MSYATFPSPDQLPGLAWPIVRTPVFQTQQQTTRSGRRSALANWQFPRYKWEMSFNFLRSLPNPNPPGYTELDTLAGFFAQMQGGFGVFQYLDLADNQVSNQTIGLGDGTTQSFQLIRTYGGFTDAVQLPMGTPQIFLNGVLASGFTVGPTGIVTFATAPGSGVRVTASFGYYFPAHFSEDNYDFSNDMLQIWSASKVTIESVKL